MPFTREIFRDYDFAIHEKLETSIEAENINEENSSVNNLDKTTAKTEPIPQKPKPKIVILQNVSIQRVKAPVVENKQSIFVKPPDLSPLPVLSGSSRVKRKNSGAATLVSGSPYKTALEESQSPKTTKQFKKNLEFNSNSIKRVNQKNASKKKKKKVVVSSDSSESGEEVQYVNSEDDMDPEEEDVDCLFCLESFASDKAGEKWIQCCICYRWCHEACARSRGKEKYICDFCIDG